MLLFLLRSLLSYGEISPTLEREGVRRVEKMFDLLQTDAGIFDVSADAIRVGLKGL